jgi:cytochrome b561
MSGSDQAAPPRQGYDRLTVILHWTMAGLILANLALAVVFGGLDGAERGRLIRIHKSIGVTILALALLRLLWWRMRPKIEALNGLGEGARRLASLVHAAFYALMILMPLSGWAMISADEGARPTVIWGVLPWPKIAPLAALDPAIREQVHAVLGKAHWVLGLTVAALIAVHVAGALLHQFVARERALQRMLPRLPRR